jgi:C_GCAxxG_C_C family probable redox protein
VEKEELVLQYFPKFGNCAQSVFNTFCEDLHFDKDRALNLARGFGGGMGGMGEICGAVSAAIMVIGLHLGNVITDEYKLKELTEQKVNTLLENFKELHGSYYCKDLLDGCSLKTPSGKNEFKEKELLNNVCKKCVSSSVKITDGIIKNLDMLL